MSEEQAAHHLLNVLEERGLDVDLDKILLGFENEQTKGEAAAWVHEYLHEETLLTKEELELWVLFNFVTYRAYFPQISDAEAEGPVTPIRERG